MDEDIIQKSHAYTQSKIIQKLISDKAAGKPLKIAFVDIDATLTGHPTITGKARAKLEELGYAVVLVTARTEEMVMSKTQYDKSLLLGFTRPKPHIAFHKGKHVYVDPKIVNANLVDPDIIIGSTGTQILVKQLQGGYSPDISFDNQFHVNPREWRKKVLSLVKDLDPECTFMKLANIEFEDNYTQRKIDIFPTKYRVKLDFKNVDGKIKFLQEMEKRNFQQSFHHIKKASISPATMRIIDDSHPEKGEFTIYITPAKAYKGSAVEHVVDNICKTLRQQLQNVKVKRSDLQVLLAGDSYPDLTMLLYGASGTKATAIVVGGSRLTRILTHESLHTYAGENISSLKKKLRLNIEKVGHYNFQTKSENNETHIRNIIFGDHAFPKTKGPETILAFLKEHNLKN